MDLIERGQITADTVEPSFERGMKGDMLCAVYPVLDTAGTRYLYWHMFLSCLSKLYADMLSLQSASDHKGEKPQKEACLQLS